MNAIHPFRHLIALAHCAEPRTAKDVREALSCVEGRDDISAPAVHKVLAKYVGEGLLTMSEGRWDAPHVGRPPAYWELTAKGREELSRITQYIQPFLRGEACEASYTD